MSTYVGESEYRCCSACRKDFLAAIYDSHQVCVLCRGKSCNVGSRCSRCHDWPENRFTVCAAILKGEEYERVDELCFWLAINSFSISSPGTAAVEVPEGELPLANPREVLQEVYSPPGLPQQGPRYIPISPRVVDIGQMGVAARPQDRPLDVGVPKGATKGSVPDPRPPKSSSRGKAQALSVAGSSGASTSRTGARPESRAFSSVSKPAPVRVKQETPRPTDSGEDHSAGARPKPNGKGLKAAPAKRTRVRTPLSSDQEDDDSSVNRQRGPERRTKEFGKAAASPRRRLASESDSTIPPGQPLGKWSKKDFTLLKAERKRRAEGRPRQHLSVSPSPAFPTLTNQRSPSRHTSQSTNQRPVPRSAVSDSSDSADEREERRLREEVARMLREKEERKERREKEKKMREKEKKRQERKKMMDLLRQQIRELARDSDEEEEEEVPLPPPAKKRRQVSPTHARASSPVPLSRGGRVPDPQTPPATRTPVPSRRDRRGRSPRYGKTPRRSSPMHRLSLSLLPLLLLTFDVDEASRTSHWWSRHRRMILCLRWRRFSLDVAAPVPSPAG